MVELRKLIVDNIVLKCYEEDEIVYFQREDLEFFDIVFRDDFVSLIRLLERFFNRNNFLFDYVYKLVNQYIIDGFCLNEQFVVCNEKVLIELNKRIVHLNKIYVGKQTS